MGRGGRRGLGKKKWRRKVKKMAGGFRLALLPDDIVLSGGNVKEMKRLALQSRRGNNSDAFRGGFRLWEPQDTVPKQAAQ